MKTWFVLPLLLVSACAMSKTQPENAQLAQYRAHAGAPVQSFLYLGHGHVESWKPLGDRAVAFWTHPNEAYLLDLDGPCMDLDRAMAIELSSHTGQVTARFDDVLVRYPGTHLPCRIVSIRPLDLAALRTATDQKADQASGK